MLKEIIQQINNLTKNAPITYITNQAEKATGIEDILGYYSIIAGNESYVSKCMLKHGVNISVYKNDPNTTLNLLKNKKVREYIMKRANSIPYIQYFKPSAALLKAGEGFLALNASPDISSRLENKISQYSLLVSGGFKESLPETYIARINESSYEEISTTVSEKFVAQFDLGHSGSSTFFINNREEFIEFQSKFSPTNMQVKYTKLMDNVYVTINAVATKSGTFIGGLSDQITGIKEVEANPGETCGNNWNQLEVDTAIRNQIIILTERIGEYIYSLGYKGMFGLDFSLTKETPYLIEINARQTQSVQNFSKLQLDEGLVPLQLIHLMEFLNVPIELDRTEYNTLNSNPFDASTLIVRNHTSSPITPKEAFNGLYTIDTFEKKDDAYSITDIFSKSTCIVLEQSKGVEIKPGEECFKILTRGNIMKDRYSLDENIAKIVREINKKIQ